MPEEILRPTPETIVQHVEQHVADTSDHPHPGEHATVREADHRGRHIVVRTTYEIEVDGVPIEGHLGVTDDGSVHYHPVPNVSFASALDLVKQLIDAFPDDFAAAPSGSPETEQGGHTHRAREEDEPGHSNSSGHRA